MDGQSHHAVSAAGCASDLVLHERHGIVAGGASGGVAGKRMPRAPPEAVEVAAPRAEGPKRGQHGSASEGPGGLRSPAVEDGVGAVTDPRTEALDEGPDDVDRERIGEYPGIGVAQESFDAREIEHPELLDMRLEQNDGGEPALDHGHRPELGAEGRHVVVGHRRVAPPGIANRPAHGTDRGSVAGQAGNAITVELCPFPRGLPPEGLIHEIRSVTHLAILAVGPGRGLAAGRVETGTASCHDADVITFDDAKRLVDEADRPRWTGPGTFYVAPTGFEDDRSFNVIVGASEALVDGDARYVGIEGVLVLVDKKTGAISRGVYLDDRRRYDAMVRIA